MYISHTYKNKNLKNRLPNLYSSCQVQLEKEDQYILISALTTLTACFQSLATSFKQPSSFNPKIPLS